jgi:aconitate hydratase
LVKIASYITDPVTTTDELIPSGETSSYRSNPLRLAEFTLSRKDAGYVERAKAVRAMEEARSKGANLGEFIEICRKIAAIPGCGDADPKHMSIGSAIYANKPGDGSAREQAAACQRVLGASANLAKEYATKRYRSNLINWGILPFLTEEETLFKLGDYLFFPGIKKAIAEKSDDIKAYVVGEKIVEIHLTIGKLTDVERQILIDGCLINYYRNS